MALIPPDVGLQLRAQTEAQLQPVTPARAIPSDLPDLQLGQTFSARILEGMPENIYRALVAGKAVTLQLPEGAKAGDTLELVVVDRTPKLVIAQLAERPPGQAGSLEAQAYPYATLSKAARLIGQLLAPEGETPEPAALNRGQALLTAPPRSGQDLAPALARAVSQSGLFYEAHQAQWLTGRLSLEQLLQEPQGRHSAPELQARLAARDEAVAQSRPLPSTTAEAATAPTARSEARETAGATPTGAGATQAHLPEELRPLVQQQLDAAATQRLAWHGEVWPGQTMKWEIEEDPTRQHSGGPADEAGRWRTTLSLTTPRLGRIDATLQLAGSGVRIAVAAADAASAGDLRTDIPTLAAALNDAGVPLLSMQVIHEAG